MMKAKRFLLAVVMVLALLLGMVVLPAVAGEMDAVVLQVTNVPLTTNTASTATSTAINGTIRSIRVDVSASANMDLDLATGDGTVLYSADDVTADVTLAPLVRAVDNTGAAVNLLYGSTNYVYLAYPVASALTLSASDEAATNKNVTVTVIYERSP